MSVVNAVAQLLGPEGYQISRSVRLRASATAGFSKNLSGTPTNNKIKTFSAWVKRGALGTASVLYGGYVSGNAVEQLVFNSDNTIGLSVYYSGAFYTYTSSAVFRDPSAWYHIVVASDSTLATAGDRVKLYVNGVRQTFSGSVPQNGAFIAFLNGWNTGIGCSVTDGSVVQTTDGYLTEVNFIDGQALTPSSFGAFDPVTGVWGAKKYAGTYGTNGFYLNFSDPSAATAAAIGKDYSGNGNNWTPNNVSVTAGTTYDSMLDVPTIWADGGNGRGNYAVLNTLRYSGALSNANLTMTGPASATGFVGGSIAVTSGKWYWEGVATAIYTGSSIVGFGAAKDICGGANPANTDWYMYDNAGNKIGGGSSAVAYGATYVVGDVIGVALDLDGGTITFYKNNVSQGVAFSGITSVSLTPFMFAFNTLSTVHLNFGQRPFTYTPPTGFKALNTQNLPDATIKAGNKYFDATAYTGNGTSLTITNAGAFQPDLVWIKERSAINDHVLVDSVRGAGKGLFSNLANAENASLGGFLSFNSNGWSMDGTISNINANGQTHVGWQWKKGAAQGFDIVTYTGNGINPGRTVAHSLGVAPAFIITKSRSGTGEWPSYHKSLPISNTLYLNGTYTSSTYTSRFSAVSSADFTTGANGTELNANGVTYVAYLFAEVAGFSKFGSYVGNGSADGPFVYCGFRPRYIMVKRTDAVSDWSVHDTARDSYNASLGVLYPDTSGAEAFWPAGQGLDLLSNGFKLRNTGSGDNASGGTYIFAAFAENPFKNSLAR